MNVRDRTQEKERMRERYQNDPEYRAKRLACSKERRLRLWNDVDFRTDQNRRCLAWYHANPEKCRNSRLQRKYGLSLEEFNALFISQNYQCRICKTTEPKKNGWHVDHDHNTKKVRGILCGPCNQALGLLQENTAILQSAIEYLNECTD